MSLAAATLVAVSACGVDAPVAAVRGSSTAPTSAPALTPQPAPSLYPSVGTAPATSDASSPAEETPGPLWREAFSPSASPAGSEPANPPDTAPSAGLDEGPGPTVLPAPAATTGPAPIPTPVQPALTVAPPAPATGVPGSSTGFDGLSVPAGHGATVSLTFDDGPAPRYTAQVLAVLASHHVSAVFCLIGFEAAAHPEYVRAEHAAGHVLCDHSRDHDLAMTHKGAAYVTAEVNDGLADVQRAAPGVQVPYYRQPGGEWSPDVLHAASAAGLRPLRWTADPRDWSRPGERAIATRVIEQLRPGGVVLMHDGGGDRTQTVAALTWLLDVLPKAGWRFTLPVA